jgi:hypothetical protein
MANFRAIDGLTKAVIGLLVDHYRPEDFQNQPLEFKVYLAKDFDKAMEAGVSLFLYRICASETIRTRPDRPAPNGQRYAHPLPVDLHFLLTAWANDASLQHSVAGWMMRVVEDHPILVIPILDDQVFHSGETVEITQMQLTTEELFRIWEVIGNHAYQISVPYVARSVEIESIR